MELKAPEINNIQAAAIRLIRLLICVIFWPQVLWAQEDVIYSSLDTALTNPEQVYQLSLDASPFYDYGLMLYRTRDKLDSLPAAIGQLVNLQRLHIKNQNIKVLPPELFELKGLKVLSIVYTPIEHLPKAIEKLDRLEHLEISKAGLKTIPNEIGQLASLEVLEIVHNQLQAVPSVISALSSLKSLALTGNEIQEIPVAFEFPGDLRYLALGNNQIAAFAPQAFALDSLQSLYLGRNRLTDFPPDLVLPNTLKKLDLSENQLKTIPTEIFTIDSLQTLNLSDNQILQLPRAVAVPEYTVLSSLNLDRNQLKSLPDWLFDFSNLVELSVDFNQINQWPDGITRLDLLEWLEFGDNQIAAVPKEMAGLGNLSFLDLEHNPLSEADRAFLRERFPSATVNVKTFEDTYRFYRYSSLEEALKDPRKVYKLDLSNQGLTSLPDSIGVLTNLESLYLQGNPLEHIPQSIWKLNMLQALELHSQGTLVIPDEIGEFTNLERLDLADNQIKALPDAIGKLEKLKYLNLSKNQLKTLPESLGNLSQLNRLHLDNNSIKELPESLGKLENLEYLGVEKNRLRTLPESIGNLGRLVELHLDSNRIKALPESIGGLSEELWAFTLAWNELEVLPASFSELWRMQILDIRYNQFKTRPDMLLPMTYDQLRGLSEEGNPYNTPTKRELRQRNRDSVIYAHQYRIQQLIYQGEQFFDQEDYQNAIPLFREALALSEGIYEKEEDFPLKAMSLLAGSLYVEGPIAECEEVFLELEKLIRKSRGVDEPLYGTVLKSLTSIYETNGDFVTAANYYQKRREVNVLTGQGDGVSYKTVLNNTAYMLDSVGLYSMSNPRYEAALALCEKEHGKEAGECLTILRNLGISYLNQERFQASESAFLQAMRVAKDAFGTGSEEYLSTALALANVWKIQGRYMEALELLEGLRTTSGQDPTSSLLQILNLLAGTNKDMGFFENAEVLYLEAIRHAEALDLEAMRFILLNNLAVLYNLQGKYVRSENLLLEVYRQEVIPEASRQSMLSNLANAQMALGRYEAAAENYLVALAELQDSFFASGLQIGRLKNNLAGVYQSQGRFEEAQPWFVEACEDLLEALGEGHPEYATALHNLAGNHEFLGDLEGALPLYQKSLEIRERVLGTDHPEYAASLNAIALVFDRFGSYEESLPLYEKALAVVASSFGRNNPKYVHALSNLAASYEAQDLLDEAEPYYLQAIEAAIDQIDLSFPLLTEEEKQEFIRTLDHQFEHFCSFALKRQDQNPAIVGHLFDLRLQTKGLIYDAHVDLNRAVWRSEDEELAELYRQWREQLKSIADLYEQEAEHEEFERKLAVQKDVARKLEKDLTKRSVVLGEALGKVDVSWKDIVRQLEPNEAAIEIIRFQLFEKDWIDSILYMALIVNPNYETPLLIPLAEGNKLENEYLSRYSNSIAYKIQDVVSYTKYWEPLAAGLKDIDRVFLSGDGVFHKISFDGLLNPETGRYLKDEIDLRLVSNSRDLFSESDNTTGPSNVILVGDPSYNLSDSTGHLSPSASSDSEFREQRFFDGDEIEMLPGTEREIKSIGTILDEAAIPYRIFTREMATEDAVSDWVDPGLIHFATHGYFLEEDDFRGATTRSAFHTTHRRNPLLKSGLLLAGAREAMASGGEGILTAYEVMNLDLRHTKLVVLSACETGLGDIKNGEGVYGLQHAFRVAGAKSMVMSLWSVDDQVTQELMTSFYTFWLLKNQDRRTAFSKAKLRIREKYPHPYYWAPFVMVGE